MYPTEGQLCKTGWSPFYRQPFAGGCVLPASQHQLFIHQEIAGAFPGADSQCCQGAFFEMASHHVLKVDAGDHIYVVDQERLIAVEEPACFEDSTARVEQQVALIGDPDPDPREGNVCQVETTIPEKWWTFTMISLNPAATSLSRT